MKILPLVPLIILFSSTGYANPLIYANPMTNCLNDNILPQRGINRRADEVVNSAFLLCKPLIDSWLASYPQQEKREQLYRQLHQYYVELLQPSSLIK